MVKFHQKSPDALLPPPNWLPAKSFTPLVPPVILTVYFVLAARLDDGSSETVLLELSSCTHTLALIGVVVPYLTSLKVVEVPTFGFAGFFGVVITVFGSIDSEKSAKMPVSRGYPVTPLGGIKLLSMTVGAVLSLRRTSSNLPTSTCTVVLADSLPAASVAVTSEVCAVDCSLTPVR